ncbi:MAG: SOS response-associated peptidase [Myxococcales bacterium]|nr:MAG: SOS response-associated peptidase [Myxococcales bacterium]
MCGRFSQEAELSEIKIELQATQLELFRELRPLYNIAPSYGPGVEQAFVVRNHEGERALRLGRWWMIPHYWNKPLKALPATFNARAEDLEQKPFWRSAFHRYRCLVPATGWREFKPEGKKKQPYHFRLERHLFAFAGLWSRWTSPDGEVVDSFAIVTTEPNAKAAAYHDRMPLVVPPELYEGWLDPSADPLAVLAEARARTSTLALDVHATDPRGNNVRFEGPEVVAPYDPVPEPEEAPPATKKKARKAR